MSSSRLNKFLDLTQYREITHPDIQEYFYACLYLSELASNLHSKHGTTTGAGFWRFFYANSRIDATIGVLDVSLKNSD